MATTNIVLATFGGMRSATTRALYQYDYGQILKFVGLDLPAAYEVHFAVNPSAGISLTRIGGEDGVTIPDSLLQNAGYIYAWVYLHVANTDGETRYMARIPVTARAEVSEDTPTPEQQSAITDAINALNAADGLAEFFADAADARAKDSEAWAIGKRGGEDVKPGDETFRNNSKYYAGLASQALNESGYITGFLNGDGELIIEIVGITGIDVRVQDEEVIIIYE